MASTYTTNKKLEQPANNDYVGNWNLPVNADWSTIDTCFGGYQVLNPTGLSGTVALTSSTSGTQPYTATAQWQSPNIVIGTSLTGTATLTASINYQLPSGIGGIWSIYNNTTGAFTVTFSSAGGGSSVVLPQGYRIKVVSDGTNVQVAQTSSTSFALSSALRFLGATSGYMGFQGPATGNNTTWTLPGTDGSAGQVLSTNGSATLSWASVLTVASALTAGSVLFANASGQIAQNNAQFYWDSTNNRLGIGTTSPSGPLEVVAANSSVISTGTAGYGSFYAKGSGTNNSYLFMGNVTSGEQGRITTIDTGIITFSNTASATERMRIDANGNVEIGTGTAGGKLNVQGFNSYRGDAYTVASFAANSTLAPLNIVQNNNGTYPGIAAGQNSSAAFQPLAFFTSDTERMTIDVLGNLGLNRTPTGVAGYNFFEQQVNATNGGGYRLYNSSGVETFRLAIDGAGSYVGLNAIANVPMLFLANNTERMRITSAGNVGIGTASPGYLFTVSGTSSLNGILIDGNIHSIANSSAYTISGGSVFNNGGAIQFYGSTSTTAGALVFQTDPGSGSNERLRIAGNGEIYMAAAQSPTQTYNVGYLGLPQSGGTAKTVNYACVLSDAGQHIWSNSGLTVTIPANSSVAYPVGTTLTIMNAQTAGNVTIAITTDTLYLANTAGTSGSRTLAPLGVSTAIKVGATVWVISGVGLS